MEAVKSENRFNEKETLVLVQNVVEHDHILNGKFKGPEFGGITVASKENSWKEILEKVNAVAMVPKTVQQLKKKIANIKQRVLGPQLVGEQDRNSTELKAGVRTLFGFFKQLHFREKMNLSNMYTVVGVVSCFLATLTLTYTSSLDEVEEDAVANIPPIDYFLNSMKSDGLSLEAPPNVYMNKMKRFLQKRQSKRNGFWIWMPARGYVNVPQEQMNGGASRSTGNGNVLRYG